MVDETVARVGVFYVITATTSGRPVLPLLKYVAKVESFRLRFAMEDVSGREKMSAHDS